MNKNKSQKNKSLGAALITGGAKRIGRVIAINLAKMGYDVLIHYNNSDKEAKNLQKKIQKLGVNCHLIKADLLDEKQVNDLLLKLGKIKNWNLLINNASIFYKSNFLQDDYIDELEKNFTIHLKVPAILSEALVASCQKNKLSGNIINMIDKNITRYETKYFNYLLSKKSLADFTKMLSLQLAPQIRVNGIAPGFILNSIDEIEPSVETKNLLAKIPLHKKANEIDIFKGVKYLLENNFITGHILFIDGGASLNHAG
jgi:NAD(P)-dependent dehydrogenase (short-subunit alcohol dehydrogenase family)